MLLSCVPHFAAEKVKTESRDSAAKPAWLWTKVERTQARLDKAKAAERIREYRERYAGRGAAQEPHDPLKTGDVLDGNTHPELFFPTELFDSLVRSSFITLPEIYPRVVRQRASDLFLEPHEWEEFSSIVTDYVVVLANERDLLAALSAATADQRDELERRLESVRAANCAAAQRALRRSREAFGRERFDRMLYEVVPPGRAVTVGGPWDGRSVEAAIRREENCQ